MACEKLSLNWNDHHETLVAVFENLLERNTLVDCTIAAEGQYVKAHKIILSACSSYFELLFSQENEKYPIIILKDIKFRELKAMIEFMYRGSVKIPEDHLQDFVDAAESLQIKGLGVDQRKCNSGKRAGELKNVCESKDDFSPRPNKRVKSSSLNENEENSLDLSSSMHTVNKSVGSDSHSLHKIEQGVAKPSLCFPDSVSNSSAFVNVGQERLKENFPCSTEQSDLAPVSQSRLSVYDAPANVNVGQESHESIEGNNPCTADRSSALVEMKAVVKTEPEDEPVPESIVPDNLVEPKKEECEQEEITILDSDDGAEESLDADGTHDENSQQLSSFPQSQEPVMDDSYALDELEHSNIEGTNRGCADNSQLTSSSWQSGMDDSTSSAIQLHPLEDDLLEDNDPSSSSGVLSTFESFPMHIVESVLPRSALTCQVCGLKQSTGNMARHMRIHTGERPPFRYPQSGEDFSQSLDVQRHLLLHSDLRPFKCGVCERTFSRSDHLKDHQNVHLGVRPHRCGMCEKSFFRSCDLQRHKKVHTRSQP